MFYLNLCDLNLLLFTETDDYYCGYVYIQIGKEDEAAVRVWEGLAREACRVFSLVRYNNNIKV